MTKSRNSSSRTMIPVLACFFVMGFVDMMGIVSNYAKQEFALSDTIANILPSMVCLCFLLFSLPSGMLMNRIGRKRTVLLSMAATVAALAIAIAGRSLPLLLLSFLVMGIANAVMQTSLNSLAESVARGSSAATLTLGQFIKAIADFLAPQLAMWGATGAIYSFSLGWRVLFLVDFVVGILVTVWLWATPIEEEAPSEETSSLRECLSLLRNPFILASFIAIMFHVGIDVGASTTAPKLLMEKLECSLDTAAFGATVYYVARTAGCLGGAFLLNAVRTKTFFIVSVSLMVVAVAMLFFCNGNSSIYTAIALLGLGNSNVFPIIFSQACKSLPEKQKEVSALMIMGLFGGTVFPLAMGVCSDAVGQMGAVAVLALCIVCLVPYAWKITDSKPGSAE